MKPAARLDVYNAPDRDLSQALKDEKFADQKCSISRELDRRSIDKNQTLPITSQPEQTAATEAPAPSILVLISLLMPVSSGGGFSSGFGLFRQSWPFLLTSSVQSPVTFEKESRGPSRWIEKRVARVRQSIAYPHFVGRRIFSQSRRRVHRPNVLGEIDFQVLPRTSDPTLSESSTTTV